MRFPQAPDLDGGGLTEKVRQVLQRWMNEVRIAGNALVGGTGTVTEVDTSLPITGGPITTTGTIGVNDLVGDAGAGGTRGTVPAPAAGDAAAGKFLKASGLWAVPPGGGTVTNVTGVAPIQSTGGATPAISITDFVASGVGHARGSVPDPGAVAGVTKFLREDATWQVPASGPSTFDWGKYIAGRFVWPAG